VVAQPDTATAPSYKPGGKVGAQSYQPTGQPIPSLSYFQIVNGDLTERTCLLGYLVNAGKDDVQIGQPFVVAAGGVSPDLAVPLQNSGDVQESVSVFFVAPIFDSPAGNLQSSLAPVVQALQAPMWEGASVGLAASFMVVALGGTVTSGSASTVNAVIQSLKAISPSVSRGIAQADSGQSLPDCVGSLLGATAQLGPQLGSALQALRPLAPNLPAQISVMRLNQLSSLIDLGVALGFQQQSSEYAQNYQAYIYQSATPVSALCQSGFLLEKPTIALYATSGALAPNGTPTTLNAGLQYFNGSTITDFVSAAVGLVKFKYQLAGSSNVAMSDGKGNTGNSFVSNQPSVSLVANGAVTGKQTVTLEILDIEAGSPVGIGSAVCTIDPSVVYSLDRTFYVVPVEGFVATVLQNGVADESDWSGLDQSDISFTWLGSTFQGGAVTYNLNFAPMFGNSLLPGSKFTFTVLFKDPGANISLQLEGNGVIGYDPEIQPPNPTIQTGATQSFSIFLGTGGSFPSSAVFKWLLSGVGTLPGGSSVTTQQPSVTYTAPSTAGTAKLSVEMVDPSGIVLGSSTNPITVTSPVE